MPAGREAVFAFLADLANHWDLADRWVEVLWITPEHDGGRVAVRGPLGLRRTVDTRVHDVDPPNCIEGEARLRATRALVTWRLTEEGSATRVRLSATVLELGPLDRALLAAGGRIWLRRRLAATIARLARATSRPSTPSTPSSPSTPPRPPRREARA